MLSNFHGRWLAGTGPPHTGIGSWVDPEGQRAEGEWKDGEIWNGSGTSQSSIRINASSPSTLA